MTETTNNNLKHNDGVRVVTIVLKLGIPIINKFNLCADTV